MCAPEARNGFALQQEKGRRGADQHQINRHAQHQQDNKSKDSSKQHKRGASVRQIVHRREITAVQHVPKTLQNEKGMDGERNRQRRIVDP